jgi:hypothetical protein
MIKLATCIMLVLLNSFYEGWQATAQNAHSRLATTTNVTIDSNTQLSIDPPSTGGDPGSY